LPTAISNATQQVGKAAAPTVEGLENLLNSEEALEAAGKATARAQQQSLENKAAHLGSSAAPAMQVTGSAVAGAPVLDHVLGGVASVGNLSQQVSSMAWMGPTAGMFVPETVNPMVKMTASMVPVVPVIGAVVGAVNGIGNVAGSTVGAVGNITGLDCMHGVGDAIKGGVKDLTMPLTEGAKMIQAPVNVLRHGKLEDVLHLPSEAIGHVKERVHAFIPAANKVVNSAPDLTVTKEVVQSLENSLALGAAEKGATGVATAVNAAQGTMGNVATGGFGQRLKDGLSNIGQSARGIEDNIGATLSQKARDWLPEGASNAVTNYAKNETILGATLKFGAVASAVHEDVQMARTFISAFDKLKLLYANTKGLDVEAVTLKQVVCDKDVSPCVETARKAVMGNLPAAALLTVVSNIAAWEAAGINAAQIQGGGKYGAAAAIAMQIGIPILAQMGLGMLTPKDKVMELNCAAHELYQEQGVLPKELIGALIQQTSSSFRGSNQDLMLEMLAEHYSDRAISPKALMQAITSGEVAATGYMLFEERRQQMDMHGLVDMNPDAPLAPVYTLGMTGQKEVAGYIPEPFIYDHAMIDSARAQGDTTKLTDALDKFLAKTQPVLAENTTLRADVSEQLAEHLLQSHDISTLAFVKFKSPDVLMDVMEHSRSAPLSAVTGVELHGKARVTEYDMGVSA
jgi:hypothetical protein